MDCEVTAGDEQQSFFVLKGWANPVVEPETLDVSLCMLWCNVK
jgi:hypothetical protein